MVESPSTGAGGLPRHLLNDDGFCFDGLTDVLAGS